MLTQAPTPMLPAGYDVMWSLVLAAMAVLLVTALWQILRSSALTGTQSIVWTLIVLALPVLGPIGWFVLRPERSPATGASARAR